MTSSRIRVNSLQRVFESAPGDITCSANNVGLDTRSVVHLRIASPGASEVEIAGLGVRSPVGPGTTGFVEFVADSPGRWPVRLDPSGLRIGTVEVQG